jgi:regulator of protease activity HflC (stomatin/prohibitin superfamily)
VSHRPVNAGSGDEFVLIVDQTEQALVLQLGGVRRQIQEPGLWMKRPFLETSSSTTTSGC